MKSEVSLTTLPMLAAAAFVVLQGYRWGSTRKIKSGLSHMQQAAPTDATQPCEGGDAEGGDADRGSCRGLCL